MTRFLALLLLLGQTVNAMFPVALFAPLDSNTVGWANRVRVQGSDVTIGALGAVDRYTVGLRLDGVWDKIGRTSVYAGTSLAALNAPLKNSVGVAADILNNFAATNWSQSTGLGSTSTNDNKYIETGVNVGAGFFNTNDMHMAAFVRAAANDLNNTLLGAQGASAATLLQVASDGTSAWYSNNTTGEGATKYDGGGFGFYIGTRTATNVSLLYKNAVTLATNTAALSSLVTAPTNVFIHAVNNSGSAAGWTVQTLEMYSMGVGLSASDVAHYTNRYAILRGELGRAQSGDPDVSDWVNRLARENTGTTNRTDIDTYVTGLKTDGVWDEMIRHNIYCGTNFTAVAVPLKIYRGPNKDLLQLFASTDWTNTVGLTGNGSTKYVDTVVDINDSLMGDNDLHFAAYVRVGSDESKITMGGQTPGNETTLYVSYGGTTTWACNRATTTYAQFSDSVGTGLYVGSRTSSSFSVIYKAGAAQATNTVAGDSRGQTHLYVHAFNNNGSVFQPTVRTLECYSFGTGMTATQATNYHTRYNTLRSAIGR